jgi:hypothetical protein
MQVVRRLDLGTNHHLVDTVRRMARKRRTKKVRADYARHKAIVGPVFGQINTPQLPAVARPGTRTTCVQPLDGCHNLGKLHGHIATTGPTYAVRSSEAARSCPFTGLPA